MNKNVDTINVLRDEIIRNYDKLQRLQDAELNLIHSLNEMKKEVYKLKGITEHHNCPYCSIHVAEGDNIDLLCELCAKDFGHKYYSEL